MDLGNIVYIVAVLAYFIYQATQNKKKKQAQEGPIDSGQRAERPASFDDLLKEIRGAQNQKQSSIEPQKPSLEPETLSRTYESTYEKPKSDSSYHKPESSYTPRESTYQKPVSSYEKRASTYGKPISTYGKPVSTYEKPASVYDQRKAWKETVKVDDEEISYYEGAFENKVLARASDAGPLAEIPTLELERSSVKSTKNNPYAQLLKNPKSLRDAVVISEILAKKHF